MIILKILLGIVGAVLSVVLMAVVFLFAASLTVDTKNPPEKDSKFWRKVFNIILFIIVKVSRLNIIVSNKDIIPDDSRFLLVCNHRSNYDPIVSWYALRDKDLAFVSKESNFKIPILGRLIRACCFMPIDRVNPRNAMKTINKAAELIKQDEVSFGIYPEGKRSKTCELLEFHNGVFKIAQKANVPVVVTAIRGTEQVHKNAPFKKTDIHFDIIKVIPAETVKSSQTSQLGDDVRTMMEKVLNK